MNIPEKEKKTIDSLEKKIDSLKNENFQLILLNEVLNEAASKYSTALENVLNYLKNKY